ncbi:hypothetical protein [Streptomyces sp. NPDC006510]|uniref:hypothetical protein n=1 Tax=Streptomyces sp. NPDC006510 TaxID=3155600 RepID=UPI0033A85F86
MREIMTGRDIGNRISFRGHGTHIALHPWPDETVVSAGKGVVFRRDPKPGEPATYTTLFMEVYPPGAAFIRGEGVTPQECENSAWTQYRLALDCSDGSGSHDWETRGYRNGAGFCSRCSTFGSRVFTGEQLGQFCRICDTGTTYHWDTDKAAGTTTFLCEEDCKAYKPARHPSHDRPLAQLLAELLDEDSQ